jgi:hypothetical protein
VEGERDCGSVMDADTSGEVYCEEDFADGGG